MSSTHPCQIRSSGPCRSVCTPRRSFPAVTSSRTYIGPPAIWNALLSKLHLNLLRVAELWEYGSLAPIKFYNPPSRPPVPIPICTLCKSGSPEYNLIRLYRSKGPANVFLGV